MKVTRLKFYGCPSRNRNRTFAVTVFQASVVTRQTSKLNNIHTSKEVYEKRNYTMAVIVILNVTAMTGDLEQELTISVLTISVLTRLTLRSLTLYIYGAPILDVSRSHTTTQHSR